MKRTTHDSGPSREVLVVEDEPQMRALLTDNLEFEGYHVTAVESAEQALGELAYRSVSLLIVDVMLPGMSGFALCEQLRCWRVYARRSGATTGTPTQARSSRLVM